MAAMCNVGMCRLRASFFKTYFGDVLRCPHKRIVTIMKVYIARKNIQVKIMRFCKKNSDFNDISKFEVEIIHMRPPCSCHPFATSKFARWQQH